MTNIINESDKRLYELNYLVPLRDSDRIADIAKKINDFIEKKTGSLIETEKADTPEVTGGKSTVWVEKKRLAYPIKKDKGGYYLNSWFNINPLYLDDLRRFLKLEKEILRFEILTEINIASAKPTRESVKLVDIDKLIIKGFESPSETKSRYSDKPIKAVPQKEIVTPKERVIEKVPESIPPVVEKPDIAKAKTSKATLEADEVITKTAKEKLEKTKPDISKPAGKKDLMTKEILPAAEVEVITRKDEVKEEEKREEPGIKEAEKKEEKKDDKLKKPKKISLEDLDKRLDDILNEEIL